MTAEPMTKPCFIALEGIEGVGKSTQLRHLAVRLRERGIPVCVTREPGGTPLGERLREVLLDPATGALAPMAELLLLFAARVQHVDTVIRPRLAEGQWVLSDRFVAASHAYQGGGRGIADEAIDALAQLTLGGLRPDVTLVLDAEPAAVLPRARGGGAGDRFERETIEFFERARAVYLERARLDPAGHAVIPALQDEAQVAAEIWAVVQARCAQALNEAERRASAAGDARP